MRAHPLVFTVARKKKKPKFLDSDRVFGLVPREVTMGATGASGKSVGYSLGLVAIEWQHKRNKAQLVRAQSNSNGHTDDRIRLNDQGKTRRVVTS